MEQQTTLKNVQETSVLAFKEKLEDFDSIKADILDILKGESWALGTDSITALYMSRHPGMDRSIALMDVRPRLTELKNEGKIQNKISTLGDLVKVRSKVTGRWQLVWEKIN